MNSTDNQYSSRSTSQTKKVCVRNVTVIELLNIKVTSWIIFKSFFAGGFI